jgi:NADPH:quinone reductase-like Zn-dependent oxidoreductase
MLVRVSACGVNFADLMARKGLYPGSPTPPGVVGYEVSGTVEAVGEGVDAAWKGREVLAGTNFGGYTEKIAVPLDQVYPKPAKLGFEQAAGLVVNYLTAWQLLVVMGGLKKGQWVLIHNAGGGVGLAALDIARHLGARTIGTASAGKHEFLRSRGLDHAIDYRNEDFVRAVRRITQGKGVDLAIDPLGGANWKKSIKTLARTGRLGVFGVSTVSESFWGVWGFLKLLLTSPFIHPVDLMNHNRGIFGAHLGYMWKEQERTRAWMEEILKGVEEGWVRPHVDRVFRFDEAAEAHRYIEERRNIGKVVLVP